MLPELRIGSAVPKGRYGQREKRRNRCRGENPQPNAQRGYSAERDALQLQGARHLDAGIRRKEVRGPYDQWQHAA